MNEFWSDNIEGVKHKNLAEILLMEEYQDIIKLVSKQLFYIKN